MVNGELTLDRVVMISNLSLQDGLGDPMFSDLSNSLYALSGAVLASLLTLIRWPKISLEKLSQTHGGVHVTDIKLGVSGQGRSRTGLRDRIPKFELAIYVVFKKS
jgi:hypothetical protein